jgi:glycosyltransferase involved in cell wall biosynthesis
MFAARLSGNPYTFTCHAFDLHAKNWKVRNSLMPSKLKHAAVVITEHAHGRNYVLRRYGKDVPGLACKTYVVRTGVDPGLFSPGKSAGSEMQMLVVARLAEKKGLTYLIDACEILRKRGMKYRCTIIGDGPLASDLRSQSQSLRLEDYIQFTGAMTQDEIMQWYRKADLFVLPCIVARNGDMDGIPTVLIEALACGIAIVSTPVAGIPELVRHEETGLLVAERSVDELADAMQRLIEDKPLRRRLGSQGRNHVLKEFNTAVNASRMVDLFQGHGELLSADTLQLPDSIAATTTVSATIGDCGRQAPR